MMNTHIFENVKKYDARLIAVTKYYDQKTTEDMLQFGVQNFRENFLGIGENRVEMVESKNIPCEYVHFIGNLQSRDFKSLYNKVASIHSLWHISHALKLNNILAQSEDYIKIFVQINVSMEHDKGGLCESNCEEFFSVVSGCPYLKIQGVSAIGRRDFSVTQKVEEFKMLRKIRDNFVPGGMISAGTSSDYMVALEEGSDIVRVGKALVV